MNFVPNVNITMEEYNELKKSSDKLQKILNSIKCEMKQEHKRNGDGFVILDNIYMTIHVEKFKKAMFGYRKIDDITIEIKEDKEK